MSKRLLREYQISRRLIPEQVVRCHHLWRIWELLIMLVSYIQMELSAIMAAQMRLMVSPLLMAVLTFPIL
uniref:Uncharacterized protein n=1 Tax=uncultured marine virus TaxID=186617 RepID=A0A0F7L6V5_9VIRU|nr:hypothetical protein [uncultured marine virus]